MLASSIRVWFCPFQSLNARGDVRIPLFKKLLTDGQCIPIEKNELEAGLEAVRLLNLSPLSPCLHLSNDPSHRFDVLLGYF